jgi:hypothetical protein
MNFIKLGIPSQQLEYVKKELKKETSIDTFRQAWYVFWFFLKHSTEESVLVITNDQIQVTADNEIIRIDVKDLFSEKIAEIPIEQIEYAKKYLYAGSTAEVFRKAWRFFFFLFLHKKEESVLLLTEGTPMSNGEILPRNDDEIIRVETVLLLM